MSTPIPLYRLQGHGDHFYTTSAEEKDNAISQYGYSYEGIAGYVYPDANPPPVPPQPTLRDMLAMSALASIMRIVDRGGTNKSKLWQVQEAYAWADAMMNVR